MSTVTKFDLEGFTAIVNELVEKQPSNSPDFASIIAIFKDLVSVLHQLKANNPTDDREELVRRHRECEIELSKALEQVCQARGRTTEEMMDFANDPQNFSQSEWEENQAIRQKVEANVLKSAPDSFGWLTVKKHK